MKELKRFYNDGLGWVCKECERELSPEDDGGETHSRLLREGESEGKAPRLTHVALAKWTDSSRTSLICPRCGITEAANGR